MRKSLSIGEYLSRLEKVRCNGPNKWKAICPAHNDRSPSLSVKYDPEKMETFFYCFAGCPFQEILKQLEAGTSFKPRKLYPIRPVYRKGKMLSDAEIEAEIKKYQERLDRLIKQ